MSSIGDTLRRERLRRGWDLDKVSVETKISRHLLVAIEADDFDRLPGGVFAKSFIRQYARLLGLDEEEFAAELDEQFAEPAEPAAAPAPEIPAVRLPRLPGFGEIRERVRSDSSLAALVWVVIVMFACAGVYKIWQKTRTAAKVETAASAPAVSAPAVSAPPATPVEQPASLSKDAPPATQAPKPAFRQAEISESGAIEMPRAPAQTIAAQKPIPAAVPPQPVAPMAVRAAFAASGPVWVSIKADGNRVFTGMLEANEVKQLEASRKMTVLTGNAGGLKITLNGKPVGPLGPNGEIRLVVLTPQGAYVVPRTPPTPPPTSEDSTRTEAAVRP